VSDQINAANSGRAQQGSFATDRAAQFVEGISAYSPAAAECVMGDSWDFVSSSAVLLVLPWALTALGAAVVWRLGAAGAERAAQATRAQIALLLALDALYLPVTARTVTWFNTDRTSLPGRCFLRLRPYVDCGAAGPQAMFLLVAVTFVGYSLALPAARLWALLRASHEGALWKAAWLHARALRGRPWNPYWTVLVNDGRRLLIAALVGGSTDYQRALPLTLFTGLLLLFGAQVGRQRAGAIAADLAHSCGGQVMVRPYRATFDNAYEAGALAALLWMYFARLAGGSLGASGEAVAALTALIKLAVLLTGAWGGLRRLRTPRTATAEPPGLPKATADAASPTAHVQREGSPTDGSAVRSAPSLPQWTGGSSSSSVGGGLVVDSSSREVLMEQDEPSAENALPAGWTMLTNKDGVPYFYNEGTGVCVRTQGAEGGSDRHAVRRTQWERPMGVTT
jgi:hypothetical protein